jgi:hypothetical protein
MNFLTLAISINFVISISLWMRQRGQANDKIQLGRSWSMTTFLHICVGPAFLLAKKGKKFVDLAAVSDPNAVAQENNVAPDFFAPNDSGIVLGNVRRPFTFAGLLENFNDKAGSDARSVFQLQTHAGPAVVSDGGRVKFIGILILNPNGYLTVDALTRPRRQTVRYLDIPSGCLFSGLDFSRSMRIGFVFRKKVPKIGSWFAGCCRTGNKTPIGLLTPLRIDPSIHPFEILHHG